MTTPLNKKYTVDEIRQRFDKDVDRFSNLETGQSATIDAPLVMDLITEAAIAAHAGPIRRVLDVGCGAGNNSLKIRQAAGYDIDFDLLDISQPMLARAAKRINEINQGSIHKLHDDLRHAELGDSAYDVVLAAAVLHHLRDDKDWKTALSKLYRAIATGGSLWITDLVSHECPPIQALMWKRYGNYLSQLGGDEYRDQVFEYIDKEDSPRPVTYQLRLLEEVGFRHIELLHKNSCFAAFGAIK